MCVHVYIHAYMCVCMYTLSPYIYGEREADRQREKFKIQGERLKKA